MTLPASPLRSASDAPPSPAGAPSARSLRAPALGVTVIVVLYVLAEAVQLVLSVAFPYSDATIVLAQVAQLTGTVLHVALAVCAVLLVQRSARPDGGAGRAALLVLGLFSLSVVISGGSGAVANVLAMTGDHPGARRGPEALVSFAGAGVEALLILACGLTALLIAVRPGRERRTLRLPGTPLQLAIALVVIAFAGLLLLPAGWLLGLLHPGSALLHAMLVALPSLLAVWGRALLIVVGALLIARTAALSRLLTWAALATSWLATLASALLFTVLYAQFLLADGTALFELGDVLSVAARGLGAVATLALAVAVLVMVLVARSRLLAGAPSAPGASAPPTLG